MWVSVEGPNGVGKSRLARALAARLGQRCALLGEISDAACDGMAGQVIAALAAKGGLFLTGGRPLTETFALMALKVREHERIAAMPAPPPIVLEDRGMDTVALYQGAIIAGQDADIDTAWRYSRAIADTAAAWRPEPELTLVLVDALPTCFARVAEREGVELTCEEQRLITRVHALYLRLADAEPGRVRLVDRAGRDEHDVVGELQRLVLAAAGGEGK